MRLVIKKARIIDPFTGMDEVGDVFIEEGVIRGIEKNIEVKGNEVIEAEGLWLMPGLFDMHVHLRDP